ncbi:MAG: Gfo/Idh/MocA family oxidoreductase [Verrucomicrobiae bacterium]|nr:Gfo/Idh/MocA family oxidoreductase [Verrucomicrobiae bacterium]
MSEKQTKSDKTKPSHRYKSAILGCGPRAAFHIQAYEGLDEIHLSAACDQRRERLDDYGKKYKIPHLYENLEAMLEKERPDILHIVTPPAIREEPMELAARFGVKGIIVEKPIALNPVQAGKIKSLVGRSGMKIAVNMQRRYFKTCLGLKKILDEGKIGDIQWIRCVTKGNILSMGPHMVDLMLFFMNNVRPIRVWAAANGMNGYDYGHPAPANMLVQYVFPGQKVVYFEDAEDAVGTPGETDFWQHGELDFWGTKGRAWWAQNRDWGYHGEGMKNAHVEKSSWEGSDVPGQREFTRAMAHWLDDDGKKHHNCLDNALQGFETILATLQAALTGKRVEFPCVPPDDIIKQLEAKLGGQVV